MLWIHGKEETEWLLTLIREDDEYIPTDKPQGAFVDFIITEHQYLQRDYATRSTLGLCKTFEELMHYFQHGEINVPYYRIPLASHKTTGERQLPELNNGELKFGHVVYSRGCTGEMSLIFSYYPCLHPGNGHSFWYGVPLTEHVLQCIGFERWPERQFRRGDDTVRLGLPFQDVSKVTRAIMILAHSSPSSVNIPRRPTTRYVWQNRVIGINTSVPFDKIFFK